MTRKKHSHHRQEEDKQEKALLEELVNEKQKYEELWDKHVRLCAEFDNTRKRWERERGEVIKFANFTLLQDLTVVLDEMGQALKVVNEHGSTEEIIKGLEMTYNNFVKVLNRNGLVAIEAEGKKFDPHLHEIIASKESDGEEHVVLEEVQKGYLFEDKVLRTAKVIVSVQKKIEENS